MIPDQARHQVVPDSFETYEQIRRQKKFVGFDDMLWETYFLLREQFNVLTLMRNCSNYMLVDEFQDTNPVQFEVVRMLQSKHKNLLLWEIHGNQSLDSGRPMCRYRLISKNTFPLAISLSWRQLQMCKQHVEMSNDLILMQSIRCPNQTCKERWHHNLWWMLEDDGGEAISIAEEIKTLVATRA